MKKQLNQSSIIKSINEIGFRPTTEEMVKGYPELKAENVELKLNLRDLKLKTKRLESKMQIKNSSSVL